MKKPIYTSILNSKAGIGAILNVYSRFIPWAHKFEILPCFDYKSLIYFKGDCPSVDDLKANFNFGIPLGDPTLFVKNHFIMNELPNNSTMAFEDILNLSNYSDVITEFDISVHARFGTEELKDTNQSHIFECLKRRVVHRDFFWKKMDEFPNAIFFVASDDCNFIHETKKRFGERCLHYDNNQRNLTRINPNNGIVSLRSALRDLYTLKLGKKIICNLSALNEYARKSIGRNNTFILKP